MYIKLVDYMENIIKINYQIAKMLGIIKLYVECRKA